jgi:hypothetical protein
MIIINYTRGTENKGAILIDDAYNNPIYTAVTQTSSKDFKSLKNAEKYMDKFKYKKVV